MTPPEEEPFDAKVAGGGSTLPPWMVFVYTVLLIWGAWYLVHYWSGAVGAAP